jgi:hypothetical protein
VVQKEACLDCGLDFSTWDTLGGPTMPPHHMVVRSKLGRAVALCGPPGPPLILPPAISLSLSRKNTTPLLKPMFLLSLLVIFDLLAQPIFAAEIWSICSPVCDSFDCPSRILFSGVFLEYFSTIGDRWNEFACLFYCLDKLFWCMLTLLQLPIVVSFICLSENNFYEVCLKKLEKGNG